jgi:hypothetical protein
VQKLQPEVSTPELAKRRSKATGHQLSSQPGGGEERERMQPESFDADGAGAQRRHRRRCSAIWLPTRRKPQPLAWQFSGSRPAGRHERRRQKHAVDQAEALAVGMAVPRVTPRRSNRRGCRRGLLHASPADAGAMCRCHPDQRATAAAPSDAGGRSRASSKPSMRDDGAKLGATRPGLSGGSPSRWQGVPRGLAPQTGQATMRISICTPPGAGDGP